MIKDSKDKQREKGGSSVNTKGDLSGSQTQSSDTVVKEEAGSESHVNGEDENKNSGGSSTSSTCAIPEITPPLIGSSNVGTVPVGSSVQTPSNTQAVDVCLLDTAPEAPKSEESNSAQDKPASCGSVKGDSNGNNNNHEFPTDTCDASLPLGMSLVTSSGPPPNGVQPLPSNVINKQPGTMEAQYMQQQSQIFVFTTNLANLSAEAVMQGQYPSIIAYHCAQPGTKKILEKHPLKMNQFNRQNPAQWLNSLAQMKQKGGPHLMKGLNPMGMPGAGDMSANSNTGNMGMWPQGNNVMSNTNPGGNSMMQACANNVMPPCPVSSTIVQGAPIKTPGIESPCMMSGSPNPNSLLAGGMGHQSPNMPTPNPNMLPGAPDIAGSPLMNLQPSLTGVKVPDENLTPQQRQHREEQLATLRKMSQMLFPEVHTMPDGANMCQQSEGMMMQNMGAMMNMGTGPGINPALGPNSGMMPQKNLMMGGMGGSNPMTPTSMAAQIEWQKLQHQFYEERKKKVPPNSMMNNSISNTDLGSPSGTSSMQLIGPGPSTPGPRGPSCTGIRGQGPPPPYHQTTRSASVPTAMPSPSPTSPNNPTSNLSLPSPRTSSGLNSPADSNRPFNGSSGRLAVPGPSPTGLTSTSLDSPSASRPLNTSNPGTPVSTHLSPGTPLKEGSQSMTEFQSLTPNSSSNAQQSQVDGMFCRTLQSFAQQKQQSAQGPKEPNLMPVPSPQQIQYLNTFEGQELTIQKQPNTSLKDSDITSPSIPPPAVDSNLPTTNPDIQTSNSRMSGPGTPLTPTSVDVSSRFSSASGDLNRFPITSPHTPGTTPTDTKAQRFSGPSPQSQGPRTPGIDTPNKTPTTDVSRFLTSSPQMENINGARFTSAGGGTTTPSPIVGSQSQNFLQQNSSSMPGMKVTTPFLEVSPSGSSCPPLDVSPTGSNSYSCVRSENLPLNPNSSGIMCNGKSSHFDPITSMAQMSQQLANSAANSPNSQNTSSLISGMQSGPGVGGMLPYNPGLYHMQVNDMSSCPALGDQQGPPGFMGMQMQNIPPHSYSPNSNISGGMMQQCSGGVSTTPSVNQPIIHSNSSASPKANMMMGLGPSRGSSPYSSSPVPQRMVSRTPGPNPYNGANVQVKASAPNTIQYLPAKPQSSGTPGPRGPPSIEFLQRFANPLSNLDTKVPTHNLQYFPNNGQPSSPNMGGLNMPLNRPNGVISGMNSHMAGMPGPNCGPMSNHVTGHMPLNGPMLGPSGPMVGPSGPMVGPNGPMVGPNGPMVGPNGPMVGPNGPMIGPSGPMGMNMPMTSNMAMGPAANMTSMRGGMRTGNMMRMQQMGGNVFGVPQSPGPGMGDHMFGAVPNGTSSSMFVPGSKSSPLSLGNTPDASQPLPPSMGQSNTFKNSPFIGPTTADPNYAQQFHNFQQQLYATNTRSQMNSHSMGPNQSFYMPK